MNLVIWQLGAHHGGKKERKRGEREVSFPMMAGANQVGSCSWAQTANVNDMKSYLHIAQNVKASMTITPFIQALMITKMVMIKRK